MLKVCLVKRELGVIDFKFEVRIKRIIAAFAYRQ